MRKILSQKGRHGTSFGMATGGDQGECNRPEATLRGNERCRAFGFKGNAALPSLLGNGFKKNAGGFLKLQHHLLHDR